MTECTDKFLVLWLTIVEWLYQCAPRVAFHNVKIERRWTRAINSTLNDFIREILLMLRCALLFYVVSFMMSSCFVLLYEYPVKIKFRATRLYNIHVSVPYPRVGRRRLYEPSPARTNWGRLMSVQSQRSSSHCLLWPPCRLSPGMGPSITSFSRLLCRVTCPKYFSLRSLILSSNFLCCPIRSSTSAFDTCSV